VEPNRASALEAGVEWGIGVWVKNLTLPPSINGNGGTLGRERKRRRAPIAMSTDPWKDTIGGKIKAKLFRHALSFLTSNCTEQMTILRQGRKLGGGQTFYKSIKVALFNNRNSRLVEPSPVPFIHKRHGIDLGQGHGVTPSGAQGTGDRPEKTQPTRRHRA